MKYMRDERGFWAAAIPAAISAGSAIAGAFGKRKKPKPVDVTPLLQTIQQGAQRQRQGVATIRPGLQPFTQGLQTGTEQALKSAQEAGRTSSARYLEDIGRTFDQTGDRFANTLSQRVLEQQPALNQQTREALAASGGLQRGAASRALVDVNRGLATDLARGQTDLALQQAQEKQNAIRSATEKVFNLDQDFVKTKLGVDRDTLATVFQTGREDLIREALQLLGIDESESAQKLDVQKFGLNQVLARDVAGAQGQNDLLNTLLQGGLQGLSTYFASKGGK